MEQVMGAVGACSSRDNHAVYLGCVGGKGGQGTSMFAAGLAALLSTDRKTVLIDLDLNSTHRHQLEGEGCPGIVNLAMVIEEISPFSLENIVQKHPLGFDLLPGLKLPEEDGLINKVNLNLIFKLIAEAYEVVVLDVSSNHRLITMGALPHCSLAVLIMRPDMLSLRCAMRTTELARRCVGDSMPWGLVINQSKPCVLVQPAQASGVLEMPLLAVLPDDPAASEDFSNFHGVGLRDTPYYAALERMTVRLRLKQVSTSTSNKSLASRCLLALRNLPRNPVDHTRKEGSAVDGKGCSCTK